MSDTYVCLITNALEYMHSACAPTTTTPGLLAGAEPCQSLPADVDPQGVVGGDIDIDPQVKLAPVDQEGGANVPAAGAVHGRRQVGGIGMW